MIKSNRRSFIMLISFFMILIIGFIFLNRNSKPSPVVETNADNQRQKKVYHCPMHPAVVSDHPDKCPICHMDLVLVENDRAATPNSDKVDSGTESSSDHAPVAGRGSFNLSDEKQQLIGVVSVVVKKEKLTHEIRATGRVAFDPELFTAIEEHRQALIGRNSLGQNAYSGMREQATALIASSKTKLKLMGLTDDQIKKLSNSDASAMSLLLPKGKVWVYAEVFEYEVSGVKSGQLIEAEVPSNSNEIFKGTISSISPVLNGPTRTVRVRAEVPDPKGLLRPDTFLNVRIQKDLGELLAVPEDSIMHSEGRDYVFIQKDNHFEPRQIKIGSKAGDKIEVIEGLNEGESVVTGANFLLDSESRLKAVLNEKAKAPAGDK